MQMSKAIWSRTFEFEHAEHADHVWQTRTMRL